MPNKRAVYCTIGAIAGVLGAFLANASWTPNWRNQVIAHFPIPECDVLLTPCMSELPTGERVTLSLKATQLPTMVPIDIHVKVENMPVNTASITLGGLDMYMGDNVPVLVERTPGDFVGKTVLPVCCRNHMSWEARVLLETDRGLVEAPFLFMVHKDPNASTTTDSFSPD